MVVYCSWLARTDPADVARVESRTLVVTKRKQEAITTPKSGIQGALGNWMSMEQWKAAIQERFPGCMTGMSIIIYPSFYFISFLFVALFRKKCFFSFIYVFYHSTRVPQSRCECYYR